MATVGDFELLRGSSTPLLASGDVVRFVDISDTTQAPQGSLVSATVVNYFAAIPVPIVITSASAGAFAVGLTGATNSAFLVDASTALQVAGLKVTGAVTGGTVAVVTTDSGAATNLTINAKGTGTIGIGSVSTGRVTITPVTTITGALTLSAALTYGGVTLSNAVTGTGNMALSASPTFTGTITGAIVNWSGLATFNGGATVASGQTLTVTGATITGLTAASVATGTFPGVYTMTGAVTHSSTTTLSGALTYGGVTLSNAVTGTGNMVLSAGPTITGTLAAAAGTFSTSIVMASTAPIQWTNSSQQISGSVATGHITYAATAHDFNSGITCTTLSGSGAVSGFTTATFSATVTGTAIVSSAGVLYSGGEFGSSTTSASVNLGLYTLSTGSPIMLFDHRAAANTGSWQFRNGTNAATPQFQVSATGVGTFAGGLTVSAGTTALQALTATSVSGVTAAGSAVANSGVLDWSSGRTRITGYGTDASTNGAGALQTVRSDGTNRTTAMLWNADGTITFRQGGTVDGATGAIVCPAGISCTTLAGTGAVTGFTTGVFSSSMTAAAFASTRGTGSAPNSTATTFYTISTVGTYLVSLSLDVLGNIGTYIVVYGGGALSATISSAITAGSGTVTVSALDIQVTQSSGSTKAFTWNILKIA